MPQSDIKYPHICVCLKDDATELLGRTCRAMAKAYVPQDEVQDFAVRAMSGDYNHLVRTICETVRFI